MAIARCTAPDSAWRMGMWLAIGASCMMFAGMTSAYVVSRGLTPAWSEMHMRPLVWIDTGVLLLSSISMESARRRVKRHEDATRAMFVTFSLGLLFIVGQIGVFHQLGQEGYELNTGRQTSFYYLLTSLHGMHVLGGVMALGWITRRLSHADATADPHRYTRVEVVSIYWHFMAVLWLYLLMVLFT